MAKTRAQIAAWIKALVRSTDTPTYEAFGKRWGRSQSSVWGWCHSRAQPDFSLFAQILEHYERSADEALGITRPDGALDVTEDVDSHAKIPPASPEAREAGVTMQDLKDLLGKCLYKLEEISEFQAKRTVADAAHAEAAVEELRQIRATFEGIATLVRGPKSPT